jgi:3-oxoacyl-[acyl-carrier-protein] synthase-1
MSAPHPEGLGARLAMERALYSAGLVPADVGYVNLHGTGTPSNDAAEDKAMMSLLGAKVPCSSTKGMTGHTLGAAGGLEALITILAIEEGLIPGSPGTLGIDPQLHANYVICGHEAAIEAAMSDSFGFGGSNCSLVFGRAARTA